MRPFLAALVFLLLSVLLGMLYARRLSVMSVMDKGFTVE